MRLANYEPQNEVRCRPRDDCGALWTHCSESCRQGGSGLCWLWDPGLAPVVELRGRVLSNAPSLALVMLQLPMPKPPTLLMAMAAEAKVAIVGHYL